jgi:hypothetical protein
MRAGFGQISALSAAAATIPQPENSLARVSRRRVRGNGEGGKWQEGEGSRGSSWLINRGGGGGLRCTASETIGRRWRCSGAALCAMCRGLIGFVGGCMVRSEHARFQSGCDRIQARLGRVRARGGWATVASCWWHAAVQVLVWSGPRRRAGAREHAARSARAGRHGGVGLAWSGRHAR